MKTLSQNYDIAIVGGNMTGSALAILSARLGYKVALIEQRPPATDFTPESPYGPRLSALNYSVVQFLKQQQLWSELLQQRSQTVRQMMVWESDLENAVYFGDNQETEIARITENELLQYVFWQQIKQTKGITIINSKCQQFQPMAEGHLLQMENQPSIFCKLLVGADGGNSQVRAYSGITWKTKAYHQTCIVGNVTPENPHQAIARQRYHQGLAFGFLPLANGQCSIAWYVNSDQAESILQLSEVEQAERIRQDSGNMLGAIEKVDVLAKFPLVKGKAKQLYATNLALVGDAARTIHPMAGQGINLGLMDVMVLHQTLAHAQQTNTPINHPLNLRRYSRRRTEDRLTQNAMDVFNSLFQLPAIKPLRTCGLRHLNKFHPAKNILNHAAMGLYNDLT